MNGTGLKIGDRVSTLVSWPNGQTIRMIGKLICIRDNIAYLESELGPVAGDIEFLELEPEDNDE